MSNDQQPQQPTQAPALQQQAPEPRRFLAEKGVMAAISGAVSGTARALWTHVLGDDS
ncbi:hypothetical protein [Streptomyces flaveolus]|uniref:hypothetical protein n=1 Tax=Streptomyces flaveolus TaxID=67297 RepID=UPI0037019FE1